MTAYKIDVQCNNCEKQISFVLYESKEDLKCPLCGYEEGKASAYEGFIYVMWNKLLPDYIKVGLAVDPQKRAREHSIGGVPGKYEIMALFPSNKLRDDEKKALKKLKSFKDKNSNEIFKICPASATRKVQIALNKRDAAFISPIIFEKYNNIIEEQKSKASHLINAIKGKKKRRQNTLFD